MNILFVTNSLGYGGAEKMLVFVANSLFARGHNIVIQNNNTVSDDIQAHNQNISVGIKVTWLKKPSGNKNIYYIRQTYKTIKTNDIDIVVGFTAFPNFYIKVASILTGIPSVMSERGDPTRTIAHGIKDKIMLYYINRSRGAVFQTEGASLFYSSKLRKRGTVIPNPIYLERESPIVTKPFFERNKTIVYFGRLDNKQKRLDVLLEAFALVSSNYPDYILKIYGSGEDEKMLKDLTASLGIEEKVKYLGSVKNPKSLIANEGIFALTSDYEGIPNALLEAMAIGLPVVATDCTPGGARMLIQDGVNGLLSEKGNPQDVAKAIISYISNPALADECSKQARKVLEKYSPDSIIDKWEQYLSSIVPNNGR